MNTKILSRMAFVLLAGICIAGCSSDGDDVINKETPVAPENKPNTLVLTGTLSIDTGEGTTRAVNANGQSYWSTGEKLAVRYKNTSGNYSTVQVTIASTDIKSDHDLEFSATLTDPASDLNAVLIAYPYDQLNDNYKEGGSATDDQLTFNTSGIQNSQKGTIGDISANYSWAKTETAASISVNKDNNTATLSTTATLKNQNAICKFTLTTADGTTALKATKLEITLGSNPTYTITPDAATSEYYVAMQPYSGSVKLTATFIGATTSSSNSHQLTTDYLNNGSQPGLLVERMIGTVDPTTQHQGYVFDNTATSTSDKQFGNGTKLYANKFYTQTVKFSDVLIPIAVVAHVGAINSGVDSPTDYTSVNAYCSKFLALALTDATESVKTVAEGESDVTTWISKHLMTVGGSYNDKPAQKGKKAYDEVVDNYKQAENDNPTYSSWITSASRTETVIQGWRVPTVTDWRYVFASLCKERSATNPLGIGDHNVNYPDLDDHNTLVAKYDTHTGKVGNANVPILGKLINEKCGNADLQYQYYWTGSVNSANTTKVWRYNFNTAVFEWNESSDQSLIRLVFAY